MAKKIRNAACASLVVKYCASASPVARISETHVTVLLLSGVFHIYLRFIVFIKVIAAKLAAPVSVARRRKVKVLVLELP